MELLLTTHPGLEDIAFDELTSALEHVPLRRADAPLPGRVLAHVDGPRDIVLARVRGLRTIHHALEHLGRVELSEAPDLEEIRDAAATVDVPALERAASFRVRTKRVGKHAFSSPEVARRAGAAFHTRYDTPVDLHQPDVVIRADVVGRTLVIAEALTDAPLSERPGLPFNQRVGLKANVAAAAVWMTALERPQRILDPFCGSGAILLEAAARHPDARIHGSDWIEKAADGALENFRHAGLQARSQTSALDARELLRVHDPRSFDAIITNPPFGVRIGGKMNFFHFYTQMLPIFHTLLQPSGRLTLLTDRKSTFNHALDKTACFKPIDQTRVQLGGVDPWLISLERLD